MLYHIEMADISPIEFAGMSDLSKFQSPMSRLKELRSNKLEVTNLPQNLPLIISSETDSQNLFKFAQGCWEEA